MKLTKKQKRALRQSVYRVHAEALKGEMGLKLAAKVYAALPDDTPAMQAIESREYALKVLHDAADAYVSLADNSVTSRDESMDDHPDTPPAHHPDTGADA